MVISIVAVAVIIGLVEIIWRRILRGLRESEVLKYEFITIIAHKFRTPLTQMKWLLENMITEETDAYKKENLEAAHKSNQGLIGLTGTLVEMADSMDNGKVSYTFEVQPIYPIVQGVASLMKNSFHEKNIFFSVHCDNENINASVDRLRIEFVLQTLFENARAYTPPGRNVEVDVSTEGKYAIISVVDQGIGISKEDLNHMFTKFYRGDNAKSTDTEGFGIGLFLAQTIILRHGGKIEVYSEGPGKGSMFKVLLPIYISPR